ncbi:MAG TPA: response regulator [Chloroflexota bacterium]|nr:response regulator [Chloroflexota bacterium]
MIAERGAPRGAEMDEVERAPRGARGCILVVDDDPEVHAFLGAALEEEGYEVRRAFDGAEGIEAMRSGEFDVVLLDLMMPNVSGWRFLEMYREQPGSRTPVVVVSAIAPSSVKLPPGNVVDVIPKPFSLDHLLRTIRRVTGEAGR